MRFGVHTGLQNTTTDELTALWRRIEALGFDWISIWDHFYSADATLAADGTVTSGTHCLEALTAHTALALTTERVLCGSLVYCAGYRHPAVLANAMATLDHLAHGRVVLGLGSGWHQGEFAAYGLPFPSAGERLRMLDEYVRCVRALLTEDAVDLAGEWFTLTDAHCDPKPVQDPLPIWIGGGGERRTLRTVAEQADGWNLAFVTPETFAHKRAVLDRHCEEVGRDPATIARSVNLTLVRDDAELERRFGGQAKFVGPSCLRGSSQQIVDRVGEYREAGAEWIILALRAPFVTDDLDRFATEVVPAF